MLSSKRQEILDFITSFIRQNGYAPSVREISRGCNLGSPSKVQYHLNILEHDGYLRRDPSKSRSVKLLKTGDEDRRVPLLGVISAGEPIPVMSEETWHNAPHETFHVPLELGRDLRNVFALKVRGTSMIDALVDDGDIVLLQKVGSFHDGEMVAVWLEKEMETTLKKIYTDSGRIRLQPANKLMKPFYHDANNVKIQGKVIGVIRKA